MLSVRSLQALATRLASDAAHTRDSEVSLELTDDSGRLRASVRLPLALTAEPMPIPEQAQMIRAALIDGMFRLAERSVSAVDIRFDGARPARRGRVL